MSRSDVTFPIEGSAKKSNLKSTVSGIDSTTFGIDSEMAELD
jgi:hypothetical protein